MKKVGKRRDLDHFRYSGQIFDFERLRFFGAASLHQSFASKNIDNCANQECGSGQFAISCNWSNQNVVSGSSFWKNG